MGKWPQAAGRFSGVLAVLALLAAAQPPAAAQPLPPGPPPGPAIDGFRGATFGMTEAEVRAAIARDFHLAAAQIHAGENPVQHTAVLSTAVPNLVPGGGTASVSYLFGYRSHTLIEVNIVWSRVSDPALTPARLATIGATLQAYFAGEPFPPGHTAAAIPLSNGLLLFRATDTAGRAIALILSGAIARDKKTGKNSLTPAALSLAYVADALHPDVFTLQKGSF